MKRLDYCLKVSPFPLFLLLSVPLQPNLNFSVNVVIEHSPFALIVKAIPDSPQVSSFALNHERSIGCEIPQLKMDASFRQVGPPLFTNAPTDLHSHW